MAKPKKGILDNQISGSIGNVVFSSRNGVPYMRAKPAQYRDARTPAQLSSRKRLSMISGLLKTFKPVIAIGFRNTPPGKSARDVAYKTNAPHIISGEYPDLSINYTAFKISAGSLASPADAAATLSGNVLEVSWNAELPNRNQRDGSPGDRLMLVLYNEHTHTLLNEPFISRRSDGTLTLDLPDSLTRSLPEAGQEHTNPESGRLTHLHLWLCFISADGEQLSDSVYVEIG